MKWYLAKLVFQIICGDGNHKSQFDEQLRLIAASDADQAFAKAQLLGEQETDSFPNSKQQLVQWKFINVADLYRLQQLIDGAELYSRIRETDDGEEYIRLINSKAEGFREKHSLQLLELL